MHRLENIALHQKFLWIIFHQFFLGLASSSITRYSCYACRFEPSKNLLVDFLKTFSGTPKIEGKRESKRSGTLANFTATTVLLHPFESQKNYRRCEIKSTVLGHKGSFSRLFPGIGLFSIQLKIAKRYRMRIQLEGKKFTFCN